MNEFSITLSVLKYSELSAKVMFGRKMLHIYVVRVLLVFNQSKIVNIDLSLNHMWVHFSESGSN